jgi:hypothetical protein
LEYYGEVFRHVYECAIGVFHKKKGKKRVVVFGYVYFLRFLRAISITTIRMIIAAAIIA